MATIANAHTSASFAQQTTNRVRNIRILRLTTGYILLLVSLIGLLGTDWDIQWHALIGRDRTFTLPHDMILTAIALGGIVALASILIETYWVRRHRELRAVSTDFLGVLYGSLGTYMVGFGALCSALAFPLDTYWHSLYGVDVSLWAPFHIMIYIGGLISSIGNLYLLLSAAHLAEAQQARWSTWLAYGGVLFLLGQLTSKLGTLVMPAVTGQGILHLPFGSIDILPFIMAALAIVASAIAVRVITWPGAATITILVSLCLYLLVSVFVPPLMSLLVQAEHQVYLPRAAQIGSRLVALLGQTPLLLLAGLSIDGAVWLSRRRHWSSVLRNRSIVIAAMLSMFVVTATVLLIGAGLSHGRQGSSAGVSITLFTLILSLLLALPGAWLGSRAGLLIGDTIQDIQR